jgi:hypothetical protein
MEINKKENLIAAGFQVGTVGEFLNLSQEDMRKIEDKISRHKPINIGKKLIDSRNQNIKNSGILLDTDSLLNELERDTIDSNE